MSRERLEEQRRHFRAKVAEGMDRLGLKGYELAKLVGVDPASVTGWRQGAIPQGQRLADLARALHLSPEELVPGMRAGTAAHRNRPGRSDYTAGALTALGEIEVAIREMRQRLTGKRVRGISAAAQAAGDVSGAVAQAAKTPRKRLGSSDP